MPRRQTRIPDQAREALQERWLAEVVAEQVGIQLEKGRVERGSLVLAALSAKEDVL